MVRHSRFHLPVPLGSTVVTRFIATMGTLTPALLLPAPGQVSLITEHAFPDIPSPTTPCAPVSRQCSLLRAGLASDSLSQLSAVLRISLIPSSLISRIRPYRVCFAGDRSPIGSTDCPFVSSCSPRRTCWAAVTFHSRWEAPPQRDFHPPMHARSQAH